MRLILFFLLTILLTNLTAQTTWLTVQNVDWKFQYILDKQKNLKIGKDTGMSCGHAQLRFNSDNTYTGRTCCNRIAASGCLSCPGDNYCKYLIGDSNKLTLTYPMSTSAGCFPKNGGINTEILLHDCLQKVYMYKLNADTLIIYCKDNFDLYYIKDKYDLHYIKRK